MGQLGKLVYLVSQDQLEKFINDYHDGGGVCFTNIDDEVVGFDSQLIILWTAYNLGHIDIEFLNNQGCYAKSSKQSLSS